MGGLSFGGGGKRRKSKGGALGGLFGGKSGSRKRKGGGLNTALGLGSRRKASKGGLNSTGKFSAGALGRESKRKGKGLTAITEALNAKGEKKKKSKGGMGFLSWRNYSGLKADVPPSMRGDPLPDPSAQEGTDATPNSVLIELREMAQSLPELPESRASVWVQFRELMQRLPPLPERQAPVFDRLTDFWRARVPAFEGATPARVWGTLWGYVRSLRPRGKD